MNKTHRKQAAAILATLRGLKEQSVHILLTSSRHHLPAIPKPEDTAMTTIRDRFETLADAQSALDGTASWDWGGLATWDGWCQFAYRYARETVDEFGERTWNHDLTLAAYLRSVGVDPSEFGLGGEVTPLDAEQVDPTLLVEAGAQFSEVLAYRAPNAPKDRGSLTEIQLLWFPDIMRAALTVVGSGSSGAVQWTDAHTPEDAVLRFTTDRMTD